MNIAVWAVCQLLLIQYGALGQSPRFSLIADKQVVSLGESFILEAVLENMDGDDVSFPDVTPFKVVQGPANSSQYSLINGKRATRKSTKYVLVAVKEGTFTIPPATTRIGSREIKSNALSVTVRKQDPQTDKKATPQAGDKETFIVAEVSATQAWVGQQLLLDIVLYTRQEVTSYNILEAMQHNAFYYEPVSDLRQQGREVTLGSKKYIAYVLKRDRLFARRAGEFVLDPCQISLELVGDDAQSFFFQDVQTEVFSTKNLKITVKDLPSPPVDFSGAVGEFTFDASLVSSGAATDVCKVNMVVEGDGDARSWLIPPFPAPGSLQSFEPVVLKEESVPTEGMGVFHREIEYTFSSQTDTTVQVQPELVYFSPEKGTYITLTKDLGSVQLKARQPGTNQTSGKTSVLQPWLTEGTLRHHTDALWASSRFYMILGLFGLTFVIITWILPNIRRRGQKRNGIVKAIVERKSPEGLIDLAEKCANDGDVEAFFSAAEEFCLRFCKWYNVNDLSVIRSADMAFLLQAGMTVEQIQLIQKIVQSIDIGKFAGRQVNLTQMIADLSALNSTKQIV
ncbi:MAG: BatD family protein [Saprospiraceae bacterium]|nr:BatD family protein [Saprospiraceae bacterium]